MKRIVLGLVGVLVVGGAGLAIWFYASTNITNPVDVTAPTLAAPVTEAPGSASSSDSAPSTVDGSLPAGSGGSVTYELSEGSIATFELDEVLNGSPKHVVADNTEVAAQIRVDAGDLSTAEIGTIVIGAQTFETDSSNRNRAIRGPILDSNTFTTIEFVPTAVEGLSGAAAPGDVLEFTVTGDLTVRDVTSPVTFTVSANFIDGARIEGIAETMVSREVYGLQIPSVAAVANVSDEVLLKLDFVAVAIG